MSERINKYLSAHGVCSRREADRMIQEGRITVDGRIADMGEMVEDNTIICVDGRKIDSSTPPQVVIAFNKPVGIVCTTTDKQGKNNIVDYIGYKERIYPVGRLDKDTEGLLLITNDGDLAHRLLAPKKHVDKVYYADIHGLVTKEHVELFSSGITLLDGTPVMPGELVILEVNEAEHTSKIRLTIHEGKFHQVKRMFEAVGTEVTYLKRLSMGPLALDAELKPGEYRRLTEEEINLLKEATA